MSYYLRLGFILFLIAAIASGILALVNTFTKPIIAENRRIAEEEARRDVLPAAADFQLIENEEINYYVGIDSDEKIVGYTFIAERKGYSGAIQTMVGIDPDYRIINIKVINQTETPGLGANAARPEFAEQFAHKSVDDLVLDGEGGPIRTITGATITTRAITNSLSESMKMIRAAIEKETSSESEGVVQ